ncbi:MAG: helicase-related protein, partial [Candidatus Puniceispirillaceae bacterium]
ADTVAQHLIWTDVKKKRQVLRDILRHESVKNAVIFCNRKRDIAELIKSLTRHGFSAVALHGDMTQSARLEALQRFKDGDVPLMIASDVAARGLDIAGLSHVFNFDVPSHAEDYVHRIGRTGRAGNSGRAFTIAASKDDVKYIGFIEKLIGKPVPKITVVDGKVVEDDGAISAKTGDNRGDNKGDIASNDSSDAPQAAIDGAQAAPKRRSRNGRAEKSTDKSTEKTAEKSVKGAKAASKSAKSAQDKKPVTGKNRNRDDELPSPPDCSGNTLVETGHVPAFLRR